MKSASLFAACLALGVPSLAIAAADIVVHRDPGCGCCEQWAAQVRQQFGRRLSIVDDQQRSTFQSAHGVPARLSSCHTAIVDGMVFEGHVPIADMKRVLAQRPRGVSGLAVTGMPVGSPGMEVPGQAAQPFNVIAFGAGRETIFARHGG
ncbi:MAG: DUF411 domain-containing protein [Sphingomonas sp.]|uniref:DUF411 domain-containing protein n=1 Tax=Sphingomonas sp. TaxID=28214 RepID=UPI003567B1A0